MIFVLFFVFSKDEYLALQSQTEQKDKDEWMTYEYLTNENDERKMELKQMRESSVWINGAEEHLKSEAITGHNFLFLRQSDGVTYRAVLMGEVVLLANEGVAARLKQLEYPQFLQGEVFQIMQRKIPSDIGSFKQGDPVYIATAGCLKEIDFEPF